MKSGKIAALLVGVGLMLTPIACAPSQPEPAALADRPGPQKQLSSSGAAKSVDPQRPDTRILPIRVDGTATEVELKLFNHEALPFTTYLPAKDFSSEVGSSEEGTGVRFYFSPKGLKDENTFIHVFLPAQATSLAGLQDFILGDQGLLVSNGWELIDRTNIVSYPWVKEKLIYRQTLDKRTYLGAIYLGEHNGKAFYAFTHYPQDNRKGFEPEATIVLENLQFRTQEQK